MCVCVCVCVCLGMIFNNNNVLRVTFFLQNIQDNYYYYFKKYSYSFIYLYIYLKFIYFWLCWVFVSVRGLSLVVASGGHSSSRCAGLSLSQPLLLRSTGSRRSGSVVVARGPSCSAACGIFPDQGSNLCSLHWQSRLSTTAPPGKPPFHFYK